MSKKQHLSFFDLKVGGTYQCVDNDRFYKLTSPNTMENSKTGRSEPVEPAWQACGFTLASAKFIMVSEEVATGKPITYNPQAVPFSALKEGVMYKPNDIKPNTDSKLKKTDKIIRKGKDLLIKGLFGAKKDVNQFDMRQTFKEVEA